MGGEEVVRCLPRHEASICQHIALRIAWRDRISFIQEKTHHMSQKYCAKLFSSALYQISTNFDNFYARRHAVLSAY